MNNRKIIILYPNDKSISVGNIEYYGVNITEIYITNTVRYKWSIDIRLEFSYGAMHKIVKRKSSIFISVNNSRYHASHLSGIIELCF